MMITLADVRKTAANCLTWPLVRLLAKTRLTPNTITIIGFLLSVGAAVLVAFGYLFAAGWVVLVAGLCDMLDGALARLTNRVTRFGAVLDSTLDRLAEAAILLGLLVVFAREQMVMGSLLVGLALITSFTVSYLRSRAEALGLDGSVGVFTRAERVIVLALGLLLSRFDYAIIIALSVITLLSIVTAGQRLFHVWRSTKVK